MACLVVSGLEPDAVCPATLLLPSLLLPLPASWALASAAAVYCLVRPHLLGCHPARAPISENLAGEVGTGCAGVGAGRMSLAERALPAAADPAQDNLNGMPDDWGGSKSFRHRATRPSSPSWGSRVEAGVVGGRSCREFVDPEHTLGDSWSMYRVIQWATGGVGRAAIQNVLRHPELELVGCAGCAARTGGPRRRRARRRGPGRGGGDHRCGCLLATDADCVMYSPLLPDDAVVAAILRSGKNVVTPSAGCIRTGATRLWPRSSRPAGTEHDVARVGHPSRGITERFRSWSPLCRPRSPRCAPGSSPTCTHNSPLVVRGSWGSGKSPDGR